MGKSRIKSKNFQYVKQVSRTIEAPRGNSRKEKEENKGHQDGFGENKLSPEKEEKRT